MNGREKIEAAFSPEGAPKFAAVICYEGLYMRDHWAQLTQYPWWYGRSPTPDERLMAWSEIVPAIGQDWMALQSVPSRRERENTALQVTPEGVYQVDRLSGTRHRLRAPQVGGWEQTHHSYADRLPYLAETPAQIDEIIESPGRFNRQEFIAQGRADLAQRQLAAYGETLYPTGYVTSPLWRCYDLWGYEGLMCMLAEKPDLVRYACERFLSPSLYEVQQSAALGARGIWLEECLMDSISPAAYEALSLPYLRPIIEEIHGFGMHSIHYFCGNPRRHFDLLLSTGADALALEESKKGFQIDIAALAEAVAGRCVLLGNLDALNLLSIASEADMRAEIAHQVAAGRRNRSRFVMSTGSPVTPGTTPERVRQYIAWTHEMS